MFSYRRIMNARIRPRRGTALIGNILLLLLWAPNVYAWPNCGDNFEAAYPESTSGITDCQLCHSDAGGGSSWNAYGFDLLQNGAAGVGGSCTALQFNAALAAVESLDSDSEGNSNIDEINAGTQPGWTTTGNLAYDQQGPIGDATPPMGVALDPMDMARFNDVPTDYWAWSFIETLADSGITAGCGNNNYCPSAPVTRAQMAVFLERGINGAGYSPPAATGNVFLDVGAGDFAAAFIEQFFQDGITSGCGNMNYCPDAEVTRDQMAVFLLRAKYGSGYSPPPPSAVFNDVPLNYWAVAWIEQLAAEGITAGCGNNNYCPEATVNRDQMAVFIVRTFGL